MKKNLKKGFTLVELVIVIAVIAILSAVLIPTFGNVINNAKESSARSEASNAITQYVNNQAQAQNDTNIADGYVIVLEKRASFGSASTAITAIKKGDTVGTTKVGYIFQCTKGAVGDEVKELAAADIVGLAYATGTDDLTAGQYRITDETLSTHSVYFLDAAFEGGNVTAKVIVIAKKTA